MINILNLSERWFAFMHMPCSDVFQTTNYCKIQTISFCRMLAPVGYTVNDGTQIFLQWKDCSFDTCSTL